jgi:predicted signal transduction protein with EAL and GGDEF domain
VVQTDLQQPSDAADLAEKMRALLKAPYDIDGHRIVLDVSIGIACAPADGDDPDQLLKNADMALYGAKSEGRGTCRFFEPAMDARMKVRHALELDLCDALANGEIQAHYQPLVNLVTNEICAVEALMRWQHPVRGSVAPAEFIPVAEETGLIVALGELILRQACMDAVRWPAHIKVAVNLSPTQLVNQNLVATVVNALAVAGLAPERLELEITEAILVQNTELTLTTLHQLRKFGVRIALDDFGTGYSSLSYLRSFPFDKIKIDRSFIGDLKGNEDSLAIVRAITHLASHLEMTTTAEGVETKQQLETVAALGCTEMQGFLFSEARPAHEISRLFRSQRASKDGKADVA